MRKLITLTMIVVLSILLVSCTDSKLSDDKVNVLFYTGRNASKIESYYDLEINSLIEEPEEPVRDGYRFSGWYKNIEKTDPWDFAVDIVVKSTVIYAKWDSLLWTISFVINVDLGEKYSSSSVIIDEFNMDDNIYLPVVNRPGGKFRGWSLVPEDEYELHMDLYTYTSHLPTLEQTDFVLYPIFNNNKYMITFQPRMTGVTTPKPVTGVEYGSVINWATPLNNTTTHNFVGWFTKNGVNSGDWGEEITNGMLYAKASNTLLYAKWEEK